MTGTFFGFSSRAIKIEDACKGEAHGHGVRFSCRVGGREAGHPLPHEEGGLLLVQYLGRYLQAVTASLTLGTTSEAKRRMFASACSCVTPGRRPQKQRWS